MTFWSHVIFNQNKTLLNQFAVNAVGKSHLFGTVSELLIPNTQVHVHITNPKQSTFKTSKLTTGGKPLIFHREMRLDVPKV